MYLVSMSKARVVKNFISSRSGAIDQSVAGLIQEAQGALRRAGLSVAGAADLVRSSLVDHLGGTEDEAEEAGPQDVEISFNGTWTVEASTDAEVDARIESLVEAARGFGISDIEADAPSIEAN